MDLWDRLGLTLHRLWLEVADRLGIRNRGLHRLRYEVKTCEYDDVRVMWEMLNNTEMRMSASGSRSGSGSGSGSPLKKRKSLSIYANRVPLNPRF